MASATPPGAPPAKPGGLKAWFYKRFPIEELLRDQLTGYYAPKNFNIWYFFGSLALVVLVLQLATGIFLTMFYKPGELTSFGSVEYIMREVSWGWLIRYLHSTGASVFFIVVYLHMFRSLLYGSYKAPRELLWLIGMLVYLALMAEAFFGYVLPWGNMSFWGAQVIVNLFGTIPGIGPGLVLWIRGVMLHLVALRRTGSNNPDGIEIKERVGPDGHPLDGVPFHPYYTVKDIFGIGVMFVLLAIVVFFVPSFGGLFLEAPNFEPANPMSTPEHIAPVWYFTPYYAILRAVPDQRTGALLMFLAVALFVFLPWLDRSPVKSMRYRGVLSRSALAVFAISFVALGYLGLQPAEGTYVILARIFAVCYFAYFLLMPWYSRIDKVKPVPERVVFHAH
jgi:ubiquinol-cytochrome c reductase cytochrome b subunit